MRLNVMLHINIYQQFDFLCPRASTQLSFLRWGHCIGSFGWIFFDNYIDKLINLASLPKSWITQVTVVPGCQILKTLLLGKFDKYLSPQKDQLLTRSPKSIYLIVIVDKNIHQRQIRYFLGLNPTTSSKSISGRSARSGLERNHEKTSPNQENQIYSNQCPGLHSHDACSFNYLSLL